MVRIRAKATDPRMVPAIETIESYFEVTVHFLVKSLKMIEMPKIETVLEIMQIRSSNPRKLSENTSF